MSLVLIFVNLIVIAIALYLHIETILQQKAFFAKLLSSINFAAMLLIPNIQLYLFYILIVHNIILFEFIVDTPGQINNKQIKKHASEQLIIFVFNLFVWLGVHI